MKAIGLLRWCSGLGASGVVSGAFAAHGLKNIVSPDMVAVWDTAVRYQFYHVFFLLVVFLLQQQHESVWLNRAANTVIAGIFCFSGSLYLMVITGVHWLGPITPLGGLLFILGWLMLIPAFRRLA